MYSTITAHTRSFQAFFCTRATSFLPLTTGRNVGLTATMQQRPSALYHILSNPVNSTPTRRFFIFTSICTRSPQNRHTSRCACFPYITLYPVTHCLLPQNQQIRYCTCRDDGEPADKRCCPLCPSLALRREFGIRSHQQLCRREAERAARGIQQQIIHRGYAARDYLYQLDAERGAEAPADGAARPLEPPPEQPERKQLIPRLLIRQLLPSYRQHHRPVQTRRRFPRPSPPVHGISR